MILQKITSKKHKTFETLYREYDIELAKYSQRIQENPITQEDIKDMYANPLLKRYFITNEKGKEIGFCLIGFGENTQPGTNWYIAEFYITPEFRHQNYGTKAIETLFSTHSGTYCYFVLNKNKPAQNFWNYIKNKFNCTDLTSNYDATPYTPEDCTFYAFKTQKNI